MSNTPETLTVTIKRRFHATAETVFDAWLNPHRASKWLFATPTGQIVRAEIDARIGGRFALVDRRDGVDVEHVGEYLEIDRPRRLVFTFAVPMYSPLYTTVFISIEPMGDQCELELRHEGVLSEYGERTMEGWGMILAILAQHTEVLSDE